MANRIRWTIAPNGKSDSTLYEQEDVLDYVQDFVFVAHDENGRNNNKFFILIHLTKVEPSMLELLMLV